MLNASLSKLAARGYAPLNDFDPPDREISASEHDLVVRYAIIGIFTILAIGALYQSKIIALPIAAGVIFGLVLGPVADWLVRRHVPQHLAAGLVVLAGLIVTLAAIALLTAPIAAWSDQLPAMLAALRAKLASLFAILQHVEDAAKSINPIGAGITVTEGSPLFDIAVSSSAAMGGLMIFLFTIYFYLATRRHLKARVLRFCLGQNARKSAGAFFEEIEARVATYLWLVTVVNLVIAVLAMTIAWLAGLPFPIFWGALAFFLNYLAFIGPIIVAIMLFAAGLAVGNASLFEAAWPAALFYLIHVIEGNWVTPMLVGNRLTVSPFLVFLSFVFWLWLWGPIGAVFSTPLLLVALVGREAWVKYRIAEEAEVESTNGSAAG